MPALQARDCPQELYDELHACAEEEHRSISQQMIVVLEEYLTRRAQQKEAQELGDLGAAVPSMAWGPVYAGYQSGEEAVGARAKRREEIFARIDARPPLDVPEDFPSTEEIVREVRDTR